MLQEVAPLYLAGLNRERGVAARVLGSKILEVMEFEECKLAGLGEKVRRSGSQWRGLGIWRSPWRLVEEDGWNFKKSLVDNVCCSVHTIQNTYHRFMSSLGQIAHFPPIPTQHHHLSFTIPNSTGPLRLLAL